MARWSTFHPEPSNVGEPQQVRDAWDKQLKEQQAKPDASLTAQVEAAFEAELS